MAENLTDAEREFEEWWDEQGIGGGDYKRIATRAYARATERERERERDAAVAQIRQEYEKWKLAQTQAHDAEVEGYQASRNYAIEVLTKALGIEANKECAIEYYAQRISEHCAVESKNLQELRIALAELQDQRDAAVAETIERCAKVAEEAERATPVPVLGETFKTGGSLALRIRALSHDAGDKVLVPREPTDDMIDAGITVYSRGADVTDHVMHIWEAMLAAAKETPAVESGEGA